MATKVFRLSLQVKQSIITYYREGLSRVKIQRLLESENHVKTTRQSISIFLQRYKSTGALASASKRNSRRKNRKLTEFHKKCINMWLNHNNELTSKAIAEKLLQVFNIKVSVQYISHIRKSLGWTCCRLKYCQMITHKNKTVRMNYYLSALRTMETFQNVIFTDETSVELASDGRLIFHKMSSDMSQLPAKKMKPKHAYKVSVALLFFSISRVFAL